MAFGEIVTIVTIHTASMAYAGIVGTALFNAVYEYESYVVTVRVITLAMPYEKDELASPFGWPSTRYICSIAETGRITLLHCRGTVESEFVLRHGHDECEKNIAALLVWRRRRALRLFTLLRGH